VGEGGEVLDDGTMKKRKRRKVKWGRGGRFWMMGPNKKEKN
jgi:hypothetical protein